MAKGQIKQKMTPETVQKLEQAFAIGSNITEACSYAEISRQTFHNWTDGNAELLDKFEALKNRPILKARQVVVNSLDDPKVAMWYLERKRKDEFSLRQEGQKVFASLILLTLFFYTAAPAFADSGSLGGTSDTQSQTPSAPSTPTAQVSSPAATSPSFGSGAATNSSPRAIAHVNSENNFSPMNIGSSPVTQDFSSPREQLPDVDKNTGALTYSYPITIPPGRNKLQPDLNLSYSSQDAQSNSVLGYGWSLSIPYIERVNKAGSDALYSTTSPVYFLSSIDGELATTSASTTFVSKINNGNFDSYTYSGNEWLMTDKNGTQYEFGYSTSTQQNDPNNTGNVYKWMLQQVRDTNNNYISYSYFKDAGQIYPSVIKYTGNNITDGIFEVDFLRTSRSDNASSSITGFPVATNYLISEIDAKISGATSTKYTLAYTTGANGAKSLLSSVTKTGIINGVSTALPATTFNYQGTTNAGWTNNGITVPVALISNGVDAGYKMVDINGDGLPDIVFSQANSSGTPVSQVYMASGSGWASSSTWASLPVSLYSSNGIDEGYQFVDLTGNGLPDIVWSDQNGTSSLVSTVYMNNGNGTWSTSSTWSLPVPLIQNGASTDWQFVDVNGDGLPDMIWSDQSGGSVVSEVYINNGHGFTLDNSWVLPVALISNGILVGWQVMDINGDGLPDIFISDGTSGLTSIVYMNTGHGWVLDNSWSLPVGLWSNGNYVGFELADLNGDGLPDIFLSDSTNSPLYSVVYINNGHGWTENNTWVLPVGLLSNSHFTGQRIIDVNGDGLADFVWSSQNSGSGLVSSVYTANAPADDLLTSITYPQVGSSNIVYKPDAQYTNGSNLANTQPSYPLYTVYQMGQSDGLGNTATSTYAYQGGSYYYTDPFTRKFAGFNLVTQTDAAGNVTKTYYHTGNGTDSSHGEYQDDYFKIGEPYRVEKYDSSNNLYEKTINKWDVATSTNSGFVKLDQTVDSDYSGTGSHKDKAEAYTYSNTTGNQTQKIQYGQVTGSDDGTFTDTGTDDFTTNTTYASSATSSVLSLPDDITVTNHGGTKIKESKYYYDGLAFGSVGAGNQTEESDWVTGSTYDNTYKTYNTTYGIVTQSKDGDGNATNYSYDTYDLYPATTTNALSQATQDTYDYTNGKTATSTDANGNIFVNNYDGLGRILSVTQPDQTTTSTQDTKIAYTYIDTSGSVSVHEADYMSATSTIDTYTYYDGLNRPIQTKKSADGTNYETKDTAYNNLGEVQTQSLPYFNISSSKTTATSTSALLTTFTYDPLSRVATSTTAAGSTANVYNPWKTTTTDPNGNKKDLLYDAYGNIAQVNEYNFTSTYSTYYTYDGLNDLTSITDASGNVRNFTYDGMGNRLTAQDLHASGDSTYGTWDYSYDAANNLTQKVDPDGNTVNYTPDSLNRPLYESVTGNPGVGVTYTYDTCTNGKGRLCEVVNESADETRTYDALGNILTDDNKINGGNSTTTYTYDRLGNILMLTNPDSSVIKYTYNQAGLVNNIQHKESGGSYAGVVDSFTYSPAEQVVATNYTNGATVTNTYDAAHLYRLTHKVTSLPDTGLDGDGVEAALISQQQTNNSGTSTPFGMDEIEGGSTGSSGASSQSETSENPIYLNYNQNAAIPVPSAKEKAFLQKEGKISQAINNPLPYRPDSGESPDLLPPSMSIPPSPATNMNVQGLGLTESVTYNDGFESSSTNWSFYSDNGGSGSVDCTVSFVGSCSYKVVNTHASSSYDTSFFQQIRVDTNVNYKVTFQAKASTAGTLVVDVGQNHSPYDNYGLNSTVNVGTSWKQYSYTFTSWGTDTNAEVGIALGAENKTTWIDDVEVVPDYLNTVQNPSFESTDYSNWTFYSYGTGGAVGTNNSNYCSDSTEGDCSDQVQITTSGQAWQVQLNSPESLSSTTTYTLKFDAKANVNRTGHAALALNHGSYADLTPEVPFNIYPAWNTYVVQYQPNQTDSNSRIVFNLGDATSTVLIDDVRLYTQQNTRIATGTPNFTAIYASNDASSTASYYEIQIAKGNVNDRDGNSFATTTWDSGKLSLSPTIAVGSRSQNLPYTGTALPQDGSKYYWRIMFWDNSNTASPWTNGRDYFYMAGHQAQNISYSYDNDGNITQIADASDSDAAKTLNNTYDNLSRLTAATTTGAINGNNHSETYSYDALGNFTNKSDQGSYTYAGNTGSSYADPDAVTTVASTNYSYDHNGNLTSGGGLTNTWDYENRLTQTQFNGITTSYGYNYAGQRVKSYNGSTTIVYPSTYYNTDGTNPTKQVLLPDGTLVATIYGTGSSAVVYLVATDQLTGSNFISPETSTGGAGEVLDYYPFGTLRVDEQDSFFNEPKKFAGSYFGHDTGLDYMNARYYASNAGRFLSEDPVFVALGSQNSVSSQNSMYFDPVLNSSFSQDQNVSGDSKSKDNELNAFEKSILPGLASSMAGEQSLYATGNSYNSAGIVSGHLLTENQSFPRLSNPQTLNAYSYGLNNPIDLRDPSGAWAIGVCGGGSAGAGAYANVTACFSLTGQGLGMVFGTGIGGTTGVVLSADAQLMASNVENLNGLRGKDVFSGFSAEVFGADYNWDPYGNEKTVSAGLGIEPSFSFPVIPGEGHGGIEKAWSWNWFNW